MRWTNQAATRYPSSSANVRNRSALVRLSPDGCQHPRQHERKPQSNRHQYKLCPQRQTNEGGRCDFPQYFSLDWGIVRLFG